MIVEFQKEQQERLEHNLKSGDLETFLADGDIVFSISLFSAVSVCSFSLSRLAAEEKGEG